MLSASTLRSFDASTSFSTGLATAPPAAAPRAPNRTRLLDRTARLPADSVDRQDFGALVAGHFHSPVAGMYRFRIAHSRGMEMYIGTGGNGLAAGTSGLRRIASSVTGFTGVASFSLTSSAVRLEGSESPVLIVAVVEQGIGAGGHLALRAELQGVDGDWISLNGAPHGSPASFFSTAHAVP